MMKNIMEYKGYHTRIEFNAESMTLRGKIEGINDYIDFEADSIDEVEKEFHSAVDDYLEFCAEVGKEPEKEYKGSFNVRINPELHRKMALCAFKNGNSLNSEVEKAIALYLEQNMMQNIQPGQTTTEMFNKIEINSEYGNETTGSDVIPFWNYKDWNHEEERM